MSREERIARKGVNASLYELGTRYHDGIPIRQIDAILAENGFTETEPAIYCGRDGRTVEQVGPNTWFTLTWHKMEETGRYEVIAYVS